MRDHVRAHGPQTSARGHGMKVHQKPTVLAPIGCEVPDWVPPHIKALVELQTLGDELMAWNAEAIRRGWRCVRCGCGRVPLRPPRPSPSRPRGVPGRRRAAPTMTRPIKVDPLLGHALTKAIFEGDLDALMGPPVEVPARQRTGHSGRHDRPHEGRGPHRVRLTISRPFASKREGRDLSMPGFVISGTLDRPGAE